MKNLAESLFSKNLKSTPASWIGVRFFRELHQSRTVLNDTPESNSTQEQIGAMVEVMVDGHIGYAGTSRLTESGLQEAFDRALKTTQALSKQAVFHSTPEKIRPANQGSYKTGVRTSIGSLSPGVINELLIGATGAMSAGKNLISRSATLFLFQTDVQMYSSSGAAIEQSFERWAADLNATASEGTETQTRTWGGMFAHCFQKGAEDLTFKEWSTAGAQVGTEAEALLKAENCPTGAFDVLIMPDQMTLQIHESIGHPLELDRILGDERNYAGSSFVKLSDFGNLEYGSKAMTVTFDPTPKEEFASYSFDDIGAPAKRVVLIDQGILKAGLGSLESQVRSGVTGVSNQRATSWNRAPIDRMANINLEGGTQSTEEMIASIDDGFVFESNRSWSIDDRRDKFQFGCELGRRVKQGRVVGIVKNPNYRGRTLSFWKSLAAVGKDLENYGSPFCGKGEPSQVIWVGHRSPPSLFRGIEVFGGRA